MIAVDYVLIGIIAVSTLISLLRGFLREILSLVTWILAGALALMFTPQMASLLESTIEIPALRAVVAFVVLFVVVLILGGVVSYLINQVVKKNGLSGADRVLGLIFGLARGLVIVVVLVFLVGLTPMAQDEWWSGSMLVDALSRTTGWLERFLPDELLNRARGVIEKAS